MKILLIQPPHYYHGKSRDPSFFPTGLGYITKTLMDAGNEVEVLDIYANQLNNFDVIKIIREIEYDIVGISAFSTQYNYVKWLTHKLREYSPNKKIFVGGALPTFSFRTLLENTETDICVIGEGEITVKELTENLENLKNIKGICFKENGDIKITPQRELIQNLDDIPFPAYEAFQTEMYINKLNVEGTREKLRTVNIVCGRGCPYNCNYCSKVFKGVRLRSVNNIIEEIKWLRERYGVEGIFFADELFVINKQRVFELCERLSELKIRWNCQGRVNIVDRDLLLTMRKSGCSAIGYGVESGSQKILDVMNKNVSVNRAKEAILETKKAGIYPLIQMMFGYPGENIRTLQDTINFFKAIDNPDTNLNFTTPLPGTKLWEYTLQKGLIKDEKYLLEKLEGGYSSDAPFLINYTNFPDNKLDKIRMEIQRKIKINFVIRHPLKYLLSHQENLVDYLSRHGIRKTFMRILRKCRIQLN